MKTLYLLILLCLSLPLKAEPPSHTRWPDVGTATLTWGFWTVYHSTLKTPSGQYLSPQTPLALSIDYQMDIDKDDLLSETDKQWKHLKVDAEKRQNWLKVLAEIWPDVKENDNLTFVINQSGGTFFHNGNAIGDIADPQLSQGFVDIWLSTDTKYPKLRKKLITGNDKRL